MILKKSLVRRFLVLKSFSAKNLQKFIKRYRMQYVVNYIKGEVKMKKIVLFASFVAVFSLVLLACGKKAETPASEPVVEEEVGEVSTTDTATATSSPAETTNTTTETK
ncbi:MAG: hypothetical protein LBS78_02210 [Endomicrobium sp.]|jgi:chemotaxis protein CheY-P-specific phosphatase CheC|nr:hypothetical protein [Endomicrobium sp.]